MPRVSKKSTEEASVRAERALTPAFIAGLIGMGVLVFIGAVMIGRSDSGEINVPATITEANQLHAENGGGEQVNVANPALQNLPNGGLVPQGTPPEQPPVVEEVQGTTTDAVGSTTPEMIASEESATEAETTTEESLPPTTEESSL